MEAASSRKAAADRAAWTWVFSLRRFIVSGSRRRDPESGVPNEQGSGTQVRANVWFSRNRYQTGRTEM